jgi:ribosomal protein S6--L-glutamate ligase
LCADRALLKSYVAALGGFPVVLKLAGGEGGVGVLRADSLPALYSLVDHVLHQAQMPTLSAYVDGAVHHRVVVVGHRAVATYRNVNHEDDFRSHAPDDPSAYSAAVPPRLAKLALAAARTIRVELAGVDILEHPSGRLYLLEANFPCYHPQAETGGGIDVSGAMVEHLLAKAAAMAESSKLKAQGWA